MFSGIVAYRGEVLRTTAAGGGLTLWVRCEGVEAERPEPKDSIAIDGVCLTATTIERDAIAFDVVPETIARSTLGRLEPGAAVNVEYALRVGDRVGGHFVYGHVDGVATVLARAPEGQGARMRIDSPADLAPMIVEKGFIAVDGVSLTIAAVGPGWFDVALIPETLERTTLGARQPGTRVNLEVDPLARYARAS